MAVFAPIFTEINNIIQNTIAGNTSALVSAISPIFLSAFIIYLMFVFLSYWQGSNAEGTLIDMMTRVISWAVVLGFSLNIGAYNNTILPIVLHLGDGLSQIFSGSSNPENGLDTLANTLIMKVNENQQSFSLLGGVDAIGSWIAGLFINMLLILCMGLFLIVAGAYIIITKIYLALLAVIGPLFILCFLFPATRQYFMSWVNQVVNYSLYLVVVNVTASIFIGYLDTSFASIEPSTDTGFVSLILTSLIFFVVLLKLPELASGLAGGIANNGFAGAMQSISNIKRLASGKQKPPAQQKNVGGNIKRV